MANVNPIGAFMRAYGLKLVYFFFVPPFMLIYLSYMVRDDSAYAVPPTYALYRTIWIWYFRIGSVILFVPSFLLVATFVVHRFPPIEDGPDTDVVPGTIDLRKKIHKNGKSQKLRRVDCIIVQIITRGEYPQLIRRNATYHVHLIERHCACDRLEVHVVTQRPLEGDYLVGEAGRVREVLVPDAYETSNGALFKARNIAYWLEHGPKDPTYPPKDKTWMLALDEDTFVSESYIADFVTNFLSSGAHCGLSPILELPPTSGFLQGFEQAFFFTLHCVGLWVECGILNQAPYYFCGAAYVVRRDVDEAIGRNYPPELCVTDDHVFGHYLADRGYKVAYINGWFWMEGAPNLRQLIQQRARWFRGHIYSFLYQPMSTGRRILCAVRLVLIYVVLGGVMLNAVLGTVLWWSGHPHLILPAGPRHWPLDYISAFTFANCGYAILFGCWHIMSTRRAAVCSLALCCWFGLVVPMAIHVTELLWTLITLADDYFRRNIRFEKTNRLKTK